MFGRPNTKQERQKHRLFGRPNSRCGKRPPEVKVFDDLQGRWRGSLASTPDGPVAGCPAVCVREEEQAVGPRVDFTVAALFLRQGAQTLAYPQPAVQRYFDLRR